EPATLLAADLVRDLIPSHITKPSAIFHYVPKPKTRLLVDGRIRFFEHDVLGAARARVIAERLRLPARARGVLEQLVRHHLRTGHLAAAGHVTPRARYRFFRDLGDDTRDPPLPTP